MDQEQLQNYIYYTCQRQFSDGLIDIKVNCSVPGSALVEIIVKNVTPEIRAFAVDFEQEFSELDRHISIRVVSEKHVPRVLNWATGVFHRFVRPS